MPADRPSGLRRKARWAGYLALFLVALSLLPPVRLRVKSAATMIEAVGRKVPRPFAAQPLAEDAEIGGVAGRLYRGESGEGAILLVPGAAPAGLEDPRTNTVALAIARAGRTVFIPELDLYRELLHEEDMGRLVASVEGLAEMTKRPVAVLGISYGGSFALIAATDPRLDGKLGRVATFGAYFDLVGVIQAITTGASVVDDKVIPWNAHPMARDFLYARTTEALVPTAEQSLFLDALAGTADPSLLSSSTRTYFDLLSNRDPHESFTLADKLAPEYRDFLEAFSPSTFADRIRVPVWAIHSTDDPIVPIAELARLKESIPEAHVTTVRIFQHVDFDPASPGDWVAAGPDLVRLWNFTTWVLSD